MINKELYIAQLYEGLLELIGLDIVHCDLNGYNICIDQSTNILYFLDFGTARINGKCVNGIKEKHIGCNRYLDNLGYYYDDAEAVYRRLKHYGVKNTELCLINKLIGKKKLYV